jgi:hypothetical protein
MFTTLLGLLLACPCADPAKEPDLSCELFGHYTGNAISPFFTLKVGKPQKPNWTYTTSDDMFGQLKNPLVVEYRGTYEIDGDLAVFTGEQVGGERREIRFGLNFGFPGGKVAFNHFFPDARGDLTYHRKWFRKVGKEWRPAEERRLTLPAPPGGAPETWEVAWKGQRLRWDAAGKKTEEPVDVRLTYKRSQSDWYRLEKPAEKKWEWLPADLILERAKDKVVSIRESNPYVGELRGFHPGYAELPGGP